MIHVLYPSVVVFVCQESEHCFVRFYTSVSLEDNQFSDKDAVLFASALKLNTTLARLDLQKNSITDKGRRILCRAVFDDSSLNTLSDSNHTCLVNLFRDSKSLGCLSSSDIVESINNPNVKKFCRRKDKLHTKIFSPTSDGTSNLLHFENVPMQLFPDVLRLIQYKPGVDVGHKAEMTLMFELLRATPCIFVSKNQVKVVITRKRKYRCAVN